MIFTRRERMYGMIAGVGLALFVFDYFVLEPYVLGPRAEASKQLVSQNEVARKNARVFQSEKELRPVWRKLQTDGLAANPSDAEAVLRTAINDWTRAENVTFASLKTDSRNISLNKDTFFEKTLQFSGTGTQQNIARLLWRIGASSLPVRVNSLQVITRRDGSDDLSVQISLSTICPNPDADKPAATAPREGK